MSESSSQPGLILPRAFLRMCRANRKSLKVVDSTGVGLTGEQLLLRTLMLRRLLLKHVLKDDERNVGILMPPTTGGVVANAAVTLAKRVAINLNYTVSQPIMESCLRQAGLRHILTSRKVLEKFQFQFPGVETVFLEDFKDQISLWDKVTVGLQTLACPVSWLERQLGLLSLRPDDVMTVVFTSGSTGEPKGVVLSFENIGSNVRAIDEIVHLSASDTLIGVLPFFHSFGFTGTLWTILTLDLKGAYHFSPLDAHQIGKLCQKHHGTIIMATPTFLRTYWKRCTPEELGSLEVVIAGAEKMPQDLAGAFEAKFGARPFEGYGATETSPVVAVNIPPNRAAESIAIPFKHGTVGRPLPGITAKVVHPDTGADLPSGEDGMLLVKGPNIMQGYLDKPEQTAKVLKDGWYSTGDIARIDDDGFIEITGRLSRFSKIGGEMVPHGRIEEALEKLLQREEDEDPAPKVAVTAVADERKGERIVVVHTKLEQSPEQLCDALAAAGLPNLWIPAPDSFLQVDSIPVLGTGKVDLKGLKQVAVERMAKQKP